MLENRGALFNDERTHRRKLWRIWDESKPLLIVVGTNPSKAGENDNDPTAERVVRRAARRGYGGTIMVNMQDVIETDSRKLDQMSLSQRCTPENTKHLIEALDMASTGKADILCGWGKPGQKYGPVAWFTTQAHRRGVTLFCLEKNKDGSPKHPLYVAYDKQFEWFCGVSAKNAAKPLVASIN